MTNTLWRNEVSTNDGIFTNFSFGFALMNNYLYQDAGIEANACTRRLPSTWRATARSNKSS